MIGLASIADPFINIVLTDKWTDVIPLLQILCIALMWHPIHAINLNILQVKGRSDYFLRLEVGKKIIGVIILILTLPKGIVIMCCGKIVGNIVVLFLNTHYTRKLIGYGFFSQMKDLLPVLVHSIIMGFLVILVSHIMPTLWLKLIIGVVVGMVYYVSGAYIMRFKEMDELLIILKLKKNNSIR